MAIRNAKDNSIKVILGNPDLFVQFLHDFIPIDALKAVAPEDIEDLSYGEKLEGARKQKQLGIPAEVIAAGFALLLEEIERL
jgi:hypothetical protein